MRYSALPSVPRRRRKRKSRRRSRIAVAVGVIVGTVACLRGWWGGKFFATVAGKKGRMERHEGSRKTLESRKIFAKIRKISKSRKILNDQINLRLWRWL